MTSPATTSRNVLGTSVSNRAITSYLGSVPPVDEVAATERIAALGKRSIKKDSKMAALRLAITMMDLTTLEGKDTPGKVRQLAAKAVRPDPLNPSIPSVASICVYPNRVSDAVGALRDTAVRVCSVSTYFPSGQLATELKVREVEAVVASGADEVDMVMDRSAFLSGDYGKVYEEIREVKEACGPIHLKVILETGELGTLDDVRRASMLAMAANADFIKTSTGKINPAATLPVTLVMLEAIRDFEGMTGAMVGMKPAGGIRTGKDAIKYLIVVNETVGMRWMTPEWFRFGASSLLNDVLMQVRWLETGRYQNPRYFTKD